MNILVHTSFIGDTGYNNHARSFFTSLNKYHTVKVRNYTVGKTWKGYSRTCHDDEPYMTQEIKDMLILQTLHNTDGTVTDFPLYDYDYSFKPDINIILNDVNHKYFYDSYEGYVIGYNVWETTEYPENFLNQIKKFDQFWVPTQWQKDNLIKQGYSEEKILVVPEGVDGDIFKPSQSKGEVNPFTFLVFGRWEYRKSTKEIIETFIKTFDESEPVRLLLSVDNNFSNDGMSSTEERMEFYNLKHKGIEILHFPSRDEYINYLKNGNVFVSCARSEGWNLPLCESMACGTPSIYSNWGAQLEFAKDIGIPVKTLHEVPASTQNNSFTGNYIEPDYNDLSLKMRDSYENYYIHKSKSLKDSEKIRNNFNWDKISKEVSDKLYLIKKKSNDFVFVTTSDLNYMPVVEKLVKSINEFSDSKIIVCGINCEVPFDYPNLIKKTVNLSYYSKYDKWYWKQIACSESLKEEYDNFVWIDGDVIVNYNIDTIKKYFTEIENYPLSDIHVQKEFFIKQTIDGIPSSQLFNENLCKLWNIEKYSPYMHVCMFIYNKKCGWWFDEILQTYKSVNDSDYQRYFPWNDEGIDNAMRWKYGYKKHLPLSNFDTSSYDGDMGQTKNQLKDFYKFWNKDGPYNFNRIYGYQFIPKDKSNILYFHGNKDADVSESMIDFIKMKKENTFYDSEKFYVNEDTLLNLGEIKGVESSTWDVAMKYGWSYAIYHEIYNLKDYYYSDVNKITNGDIVVDLGGNIGVFNRWAYSQGASKVISFEPDRRYFKLLSMNSRPDSILFNAAVSDKVGTIDLYESDHLGGSNIFTPNTSNVKHYSVRTYTLDYLFEAGLVDRIDFLKIDIEGAELMALKGISDDNLMKVKTIAMEYHHEHLNFDEELRHNMILRLNSLGFNSYLLFCGVGNKLQLIYFWK
jgi:glycosyltransferase involved in cell wall biosynthesis